MAASKPASRKAVVLGCLILVVGAAFALGLVLFVISLFLPKESPPVAQSPAPAASAPAGGAPAADAPQAPLPTLGPDIALDQMAKATPAAVNVSTLYRVKSDKVMATFKRTIEVELFKHESEATLSAICRQVKALNPVVVDRTFINFDVRGEPKPPQMSNWAIARFDPELSVRILGDD